MKVIYKYEVPVDDQVHWFKLPEYSNIIHVACQHSMDIVTFWAVIDDQDKDWDIAVDRSFKVVGTGQPYEGRAIGSCLTAGNNLVWHLIEVL